MTEARRRVPGGISVAEPSKASFGIAVGQGATPRRPSRPAVRAHEAGHAIVQLATGPAPWIDYVGVEGLEGDLLKIVHTEAM